MQTEKLFRVAGVAMAAAFLGSCAILHPKVAPSARSVGNEPTQAESFPIIDAHLHTAFNGKPESYSKISYTEEEMLKEFRSAGVVGAVSHLGRDNGKGYKPELSSHGVIQCFGAVANSDLKTVEAGLKAHHFRCIKVYLGYVHQFANHPAYRALYQLARKYKVPVVFHTGDTYSIKGKLKFADPLTVDEVAVDFPDVTFVIAHIGNPWIQSAAEVAYKNPNVYLDGSALMIGDLSRLSDEALEESVVKPLRWTWGYLEDPSKLMFGSDWPLTEIAPYVRAFKKAIPREHWSKVFYENAAHVFQIDPAHRMTSGAKQ